MEEVVKAIEKLSEKDIFDYLLIIIPIVISVLAVIISVATAKRQNEIAMFELRYKALATLKQVKKFACVFYITNQPELVVQSFNSCFAVSIDRENQLESLVHAANKMNDIEEVIAVISDVINSADKRILEKTIAMLSKILNSAITGDIDRQNIEDFKVLCICLEKIVIKKVTKKVLGSSWCFEYYNPYEKENAAMLENSNMARIEKQIADIVKKDK